MAYLFLVILFLMNFAQAHDLQYSLKKFNNNIVLISFYFPDGSKFSYESFEIYREGEKIPFQTGRTDALGRVVFIPDKEGQWIVKVYSEDGHGTNVKIKIDQSLDITTQESLFKRYEKTFIGVGLILGIIGIISLFKCRR
ncbi:hypothetical protein [Sulfurihydrogenibium sp.]|uniref:hypothetical protein n=1 Tax=Sulfurihydrogenibium sp. TaxID=2053621 RepID=UPI00261FB2B8|nr:hypothetical protein [Sulfurihydrogenibium sp.]